FTRVPGGRARPLRVGKVACREQEYIAPASRDLPTRSNGERDGVGKGACEFARVAQPSDAPLPTLQVIAKSIEIRANLTPERTSARMASILMDLIRSYLKLTAASALALGTALSPASAQVPASGRPIVAVLPLENNSGDATQDFFAEGMTDEIAAALTGVPGIDVVARSSSFRFKQPNRDIKAVGAALKVSYVVQ